MTVADVLLLALGAVAVGSGAAVVTTSHLVRAGQAGRSRSFDAPIGARVSMTANSSSTTTAPT